MKFFLKFGKALAIALCCMLCVFLTAEAAHSHPAGLPSATHCQLCVAAHIALHSPIVVAAGIVLARQGTVEEGAPSPGFSAMRVTPRIRPPPAGLKTPFRTISLSRS